MSAQPGFVVHFHSQSVAMKRMNRQWWWGLPLTLVALVCVSATSALVQKYKSLVVALHHGKRLSCLSLVKRNEPARDVFISTDGCFNGYNCDRRSSFVRGKSIIVAVFLSATCMEERRAVASDVDVTDVDVDVDVVAQGYASIAEKIQLTPKSIQKPFASTEALIPAIRVKLMIDRAVTLSNALPLVRETNGTDLQQQQSSILDELQSLLLSPQTFIDTPNEYDKQLSPVYTPAQSYLDVYKTRRSQLNLLQQPGAWLVQQGEIASWRNLKEREYKMAQKDPIRAALNYYTNQLEFSSSQYILRVEPALRKQMIRNDALPDIRTQVIASDLGLRYLYRNQVLTCLEDARAELNEYIGTADDDGSTDSSSGSFELYNILRQAQQAMERWLSLIDENDIQQAMETVLAE